MSAARSAWLRPVIGAIPLVVTLAILWVSARSSYFYSDDFVNFSTAHAGLGPTLLNDQLFGHWIPGRRLLDWIVQHHRPINWDGLVALMVAMVGISSLLLRALVAAMTGKRTLAWIAAAVLPLTAGIGGTVQWYSAAAEPVPAMIFMLAALLFVLRFLRGSSVWTLAAAIVAMLAGLMFDERVAPIVIVFPVLVWIVERPIRQRRVWVAIATPLLGTVVWYVFQLQYTRTAVAAAHPDLAGVADFTLRGLVQNTFPGLLGIYSRPMSSPGGLAGLWVIGAVIVVAVVAVAVISRRATAFLPLLWFLVLSLAVFAATGWVRGLEFGPSAALEERYSAILMPVGLLAITLVIAPFPWPKLVARRRALVAGLAVLALVGPLWGAVNLSQESLGRGAHAWADRFLDEAKRHPGLAYFDAEVPEAVVPPAFYPASLLSRVLPVIDPRLSTDVTSHTGLVISANGTVSVGRVQQESYPTVTDVSGFVADPSSSRQCWTSTESRSSISLDLTPVLPVARQYLALDVTVSDPTNVTVIGGASSDAINRIDYGFVGVDLPEGDSTLTAGFSGRMLGAIRLDFVGAHRVCLGHGAAGRVK